MMGRTDLGNLLDTLCPMFVVIDGNGVVERIGPTLRKLRPDHEMVGKPYAETFDLVRPKFISDVAGLISAPGGRVNLKFKDAPRTALKGLVVPLACGNGAVINLSFGISILDAVRDYELTSADFSGTDLAIELLYLVEAKSAAMEASRSLNLRLQGAMLAAEERAYTDTLTGLKNRRAMDHILEHLISAKSSFALMHLDLDFFKSVNDTLGHAAGDYVLQQAAKIMLQETRGEDTVARVGGDEFVLIFKGLVDLTILDRIAARLIVKIQEPMDYNGIPCTVSASIGTALSTQFHAPNGAEVLNAADRALYDAKEMGRSRHSFFDAPDNPIKSDRNLGPDHAA